MSEEWCWKTIPSFPEYEVSNIGNIRRNGKILSTTLSYGYKQLKLSVNGKIKTKKVHSLVCETYHGPKPSWASVVAHNDGDKTNNRAENVRWTNHKENSNDMINHKTKLYGENHPMAILSENEVNNIRNEYWENKSGKYVKRGTIINLCKKYNVGRHVIKDIIGNRSWK